MRLRDILNNLKERGEELRYRIQYTGPNRKLVRLGESQSRKRHPTSHGFRMKPKNQSRDKQQATGAI